VAKARRFLKPDARVLDIGCADGTLSRASTGIRRYVGVDPDVAEPGTRGGVTFIRGTFPNAEIADDERFDLVAALAVLEHIPADAQVPFARACAERLSPGGFVVITVPSPAVDAIIHGLKRLGLLEGMHEEEHHGYRPGDTPKLFEPHGLTLHCHRRFELGLNHLFVFQRPLG
jgi:2-polyprenyl-3-methyl-5-hydroxy-6-metoxy-1,4-benzoquinol methylase